MRVIRIDWSGFARTGHWLMGSALLGHLVREVYAPRIASGVYKAHSVLPMTREARR